MQDSWSILDNVTLNAGVRYDAQTLNGLTTHRASPARTSSPRVGVIYDFTEQGRSKIFANYARYYEKVPLNLVDRGFPGEQQHPGRPRQAPTVQPARGLRP